MWELKTMVPISKLGKSWLTFLSGLNLPLLMCNMRGDNTERLAEIFKDHLDDFMTRRTNGQFRFLSTIIVTNEKIVFTDDLKEGYPEIIEIIKV